ncbi:MAG: LTA synthase family protein [Pseudomonadota bacterium]
MPITEKNSRTLWQTLALFKPAAYFAVVTLGLLSASRFMLALLYSERVNSAISWFDFMVLGVRADLIQIGYFVLIPTLLFSPLSFALNRPTIQRWWRRLWTVWFLVCALVLWFMEISTPAFLAQYDTRPNRLFFEYLAYPKEVFSMLMNGFAGWLFTGIASTLLFVYLAYRWYKKAEHGFKPRAVKRRYLITFLPVLIITTLFGIRSTLAHRPANPAFFAVTSDAMVNSLILNSTYTLEYALYNLKHEAQANRVYGKLTDDEVVSEVLKAPYLANAEFPFTDYPTVHYQPASVTRTTPLNIVVILEESLGATFVQSLGGKPLTPNIERLKSQGWWFENLYATGIRSVRGIEAVISGFLPTRARSAVKLSSSQRQFFTLADALSREGYNTEFIYGGQAHFDNMASFFVGNGFQSIIDQDGYDAPQFLGSWGVSDQDLFNKLHQRLSQTDNSAPQFTLAFTSSNHEPFEFPDNEIVLAEQPKQTVNNAVKYADHALGEFFAKAKKSDYWHNTLFLVVADHDTRVYGNELVPVDKFHIPGLILGADIRPKTVSEIVSQIDLAPTLLSLAGVSTYTPTVGQDLSRPEFTPMNRAMMQFGDNYGWLESGKNGQILTVLQVGQPPQLFRFEPEQKTFLPLKEPVNGEHIRKVTSYAMLPSVLYQKRAYYVPALK